MFAVKNHLVPEEVLERESAGSDKGSQQNV